MSGAPHWIIRAVRFEDLEEVLVLRDEAGPGFTSLAVDDDALAARLKHSVRSFAAPERGAPDSERYVIVLENVKERRVVGMAGVKAAIGLATPFFNFRVLKIAQASAAARRRFDMDVLILVNEFHGCSEVGSLFVRAAHRAGGVGRALAQTRYMLMASAPQRFGSQVVSELRGVVDADGASPFWEHLGRKFFRMSFAEADRLSATTDNQFILDLMPKYPIYADLLPEAARAVIGACHVDGQGAKRLLEWEGFRFADVVDIFDGGPLMVAPRDGIRTVREARRLRVRAGSVTDGRRGLVATPWRADFRCAPTHVTVSEEEAIVDPATLEALGLAPSDEAIVWVDHGR